MRIFTAQVGEYSNWVGAHYWSSLARSEGETSEFFNESPHGERLPRAFLLDNVDSLGPAVPQDASAQNIEGFKVEKIVQDFPGSKNAESRSAQYWTDIWELGQLPENRLVLPPSQTPTDLSYRFWFEYDRMSLEKVDETKIRKLVEETDGSVDQVRTLVDMRNGMAGFAPVFNEYLGSCYPKSSNLNLTSPLPAIEHMNHDHAVPLVVNLLNFIVAEKKRTEELSPSLIVVPPHRNLDIVSTTAQEAVWLDSIPFQFKNRVHSLNIESPYLSIDARMVFSPLAPGEHGTIAHSVRERNYCKNSWNPIPIESTSQIVTGTFESKASLPFLEGSIGVLRRFTSEFQAAWEPHSNIIERDDLLEAIDTLKSIVNSLRDELDE